MGKYLELFKGAFDDSIGTKTKPENKPYIGYSLTEGKMAYTVVPKPVTGPADNEIWYTTNDGATVTPKYLSNFGAGFVENVYEDGKGILRFNGPVTHIPGNSNSRIISQDLAGAFRGCSSLTSITIPNSVTSIGGEAFYNCSSLTSITIPNSVTSIGGSAFYGCSSLTKTNYTGDITGWCNIKFGDDYANPMYYSHNFYINDQEIRDLVIPNGVDTINNYAFYNCSSLTSVTIPNSVTVIGWGAFRDCSSITSITFEGTVEEWNTITKNTLWNDNVSATHVQCSDGQVAL